jgi:hypothetical protein
MDHHCHCLTGLCAQHHFGAVYRYMVAAGISFELSPNELCDRHALPLTGAQEFMRGCHRPNAAVECGYEMVH